MIDAYNLSASTFNTSLLMVNATKICKESRDVTNVPGNKVRTECRARLTAALYVYILAVEVPTVSKYLNVYSEMLRDY